MENYCPSTEIHRNWLHLPVDVTLIIFNKLEASDLLESAQFVSKLWYDLCKDPSLWQIVRVRDPEAPALLEETYIVALFWLTLTGPKTYIKHYGMMCNAVDRSNGDLIALDIEDYSCTPKLLSYAVSRSSKLKRLRLASCNISGKAMKEALEKLACLEELELTLCSEEEEAASFISSCGSLTTFKLNMLGSLDDECVCDVDALAVAQHMPELRHLQLIGNNMSNVGLIAILDSCLHLQSLDLRACFQLHLTGNLKKRLSEQIKDLQLPDDSTDDYAYDTIDYSGGDYYLHYEDYDYDDDDDDDDDDVRY